ncbi:HalOD1 output domain-containing protein [Halorubrum sp. DTA46]|uniref:HalOD1 output domain-containing protein n=1 Tax=Halorubrum sp. DTA46 TaxID=3402162 RepID=UPI003AAD4BEE
MRRTLDNFQPLLSRSRNYQIGDGYKKGGILQWSMAQSQTSAAHVDSVICEVVTKIAQAEDVDPLELTPPLFEVIDPDALAQILATTPIASRMEVRVTFSYNGHEVTVGGDNVVKVVSR